MTVPGKRKSKSRAKRGKILVFPKRSQLVACPKCKKPILPHQVCFFCGNYKGRQVIEMHIKKIKDKKKEDKT